MAQWRVSQVHQEGALVDDLCTWKLQNKNSRLVNHLHRQHINSRFNVSSMEANETRVSRDSRYKENTWKS